MKLGLLLPLAGLSLVACSSSSAGDDSSVVPGSGVIQNPGGKPKNEDEARMGSQLQQQGNAMNDARAKAAEAEAAARAKAGGK